MVSLTMQQAWNLSWRMFGLQNQKTTLAELSENEGQLCEFSPKYYVMIVNLLQLNDAGGHQSAI